MLGLMQTKYLVLTKNDIRKRQKEAVESVISILGISDEDASKLLRRYKWFVRCWNRGAGWLHLNEANVIRDVFVCECRDANRVNEEWFADMEGVKAAVGMFDEQPDPPGSQDKVKASPDALLVQCMRLLWGITELHNHLSAVHSCTAQQRCSALALL
jgi:hypothetical protein